MHRVNGALLLCALFAALPPTEARAPAPLPSSGINEAEAVALLVKAYPKDAESIKKLPHRFVIRIPWGREGQTLNFAVASEKMTVSKGGKVSHSATPVNSGRPCQVLNASRRH